MNQKPVFNEAKKEIDIQDELNKGKTREQIAADLDDNDLDDDGIDDEFAYEELRSKASCSVAKIKGFLYGGFSSRFWMLRKHINSLDRAKLELVPFYNWECITLELEFRDVDIVIKDIGQMDVFLKFLIYTLRTIDGKRGTAEAILRQTLEKQTRGRNAGYALQDSLKKHNEHLIF